MKVKLFVIIILTFCQYTQSSNISENLADIICKSFGQIKCPFDNYCVKERDACRYCPSGSDKDCSLYAGNDNYGKCNLKGRYKYYEKMHDACNAILDCPINTTYHDEDGCDSDSKCKEMTQNSRNNNCYNGETKCVVDYSECDDCKTEFGGDENKCNETYCNNLEVSGYDTFLFGKHQTYRKCPESPKCILKGQFCDGKNRLPK